MPLGRLLGIVALEKASRAQMLEMGLSNLKCDKNLLLNDYRLGMDKKTDQYLSELIEEYNDFGSLISYLFHTVGPNQGLEVIVELSEFALVEYSSGIDRGIGPFVFVENIETRATLELSILEKLMYGVVEDLIVIKNGQIQDFILVPNKHNLKLEVRWLS